MAVTPSQIDAYSLGKLMTPGIRSAVFAELETLLREESDALIKKAVDRALARLLMELQSIEQFKDKVLQLSVTFDGISLAVEGLPEAFKVAARGPQR